MGRSGRRSWDLRKGQFVVVFVNLERNQDLGNRWRHLALGLGHRSFSATEIKAVCDEAAMVDLAFLFGHTPTTASPQLMTPSVAAASR